MLKSGHGAVANRLINAHNRSRTGSSSPAVATKHKKSALLVDDVKVTQKVTSVALHQSGFVCDVAGDGEEAVRLAIKNAYYVILMDVQLPGLDGVEATIKIREFEEEKNDRGKSIIFGLTGSCKEEDLERYNSAGMDGCIEKGCVVSRAMHEALAMKKENPDEFIFINARNVQSIRSKYRKDSMDQSVQMSLDKDVDSPAHSAAGTPTSSSSRMKKMSISALQDPISPRTDSPHHYLKIRTQLSASSSLSGQSPILLPSKRSALLVDDVKVTQRITSAALQKTGYSCDLAADGQAAVDMAKANAYYVILMDVQLPVIDGVEATRQIRAYEKEVSRAPSIIFGLTGNCSDEALGLYAESGMDGCMEKGCVVSRAIHEALAMKEENPSLFLFIDSRNVHFKLQDDSSTASIIESSASN
jgi:CheY-like chemotaxis protein